jgi:hypothetical protein
MGRSPIIGERPVMASGLAGCAALVGVALATTYAALLVALLSRMFGSARPAPGRAVMAGSAHHRLRPRHPSMALPLGGALAC